MLTVKIFCFNEFSENTLVIHDGKECIFVDPGCYEPYEVNELITYVENHNLTPISIVNTHCHIDHVLGVDKIKNHFQIQFIIGRNELSVLKSQKVLAPLYGYNGFSEPMADGFMTEGDIIRLGSQKWEVLDVPGHSPGHIAILNRKEGLCISGDVLFNQSIGRTDLPGGDYDTLINSIKSKLFILPEETKIIPGHGPETTVRQEKKYNPFCGESAM
jgi:glyoxylase-like metal-dependent hydrolase (beta-lactamase superfamily II)